MTSTLTSAEVTASEHGEAVLSATSSARVLRFDRTQRLVHWTQALTFLLLLVTGLMISIAQLETLVGHRALLREIHLTTAFFFVFGPALVALAGNYHSVRADMKSVDEWTKDDLRWLAQPVSLSPEVPPVGRFNAGQKLNAIFTVYSTVAFAVTGLIIWQNRRFPFKLVSQANTIHNWLAYIALTLFLGHLYLSTMHHSTRKSFWGIMVGGVDRVWASQHHRLWSPAGRESPIDVVGLVRSAIVLLLGLEAALLAVRFGFEALGANVTDPVTRAFYRFSGLPGTLGHTSTGNRAFDLGAVIWLGMFVTAAIVVKRRQSFFTSLVPITSRNR